MHAGSLTASSGVSMGASTATMSPFTTRNMSLGQPVRWNPAGHRPRLVWIQTFLPADHLCLMLLQLLKHSCRVTHVTIALPALLDWCYRLVSKVQWKVLFHSWPNTGDLDSSSPEFCQIWCLCCIYVHFVCRCGREEREFCLFFKHQL